MNRMSLPAVWICLLALAVPLAAATPVTVQPRPEALSEAGEIDLAAALSPLFGLAREGRSGDLLRALRELESDARWPVAARERTLHAFALGLADLDSGSIDSRVLDYLQSIEPRTYVPHDDNPRAGVPLFNIRAAAAGAQARWQREEGELRSLSGSGADGDAWIDAYLAQGPKGRQGYRDSMPYMDDPFVRELGERALQDGRASAELTAVAARSALILEDPELLGEVLEKGRGAALAPAIRASRISFTPDELRELLKNAIAHAEPATAALTLAEWGPGLLDAPETVDLIFDLLSSPELGSAAALVLSRSGRGDLFERLNALANDGDGLASKRAGMALVIAAAGGGAR